MSGIFFLFRAAFFLLISRKTDLMLGRQVQVRSARSVEPGVEAFEARCRQPALAAALHRQRDLGDDVGSNLCWHLKNFPHQGCLAVQVRKPCGHLGYLGLFVDYLFVLASKFL